MSVKKNQRAREGEERGHLSQPCVTYSLVSYRAFSFIQPCRVPRQLFCESEIIDNEKGVYADS